MRTAKKKKNPFFVLFWTLSYSLACQQAIQYFNSLLAKLCYYLFLEKWNKPYARRYAIT